MMKMKPNYEEPDWAKGLRARLDKMIELHEGWKGLGLDEEIIEAYLMCKTKLSKRDIKMVLKARNEFMEKLKKKAVVEKL